MLRTTYSGHGHANISQQQQNALWLLNIVSPHYAQQNNRSFLKAASPPSQIIYSVTCLYAGILAVTACSHNRATLPIIVEGAIHLHIASFDGLEADSPGLVSADMIRCASSQADNSCNVTSAHK
jgi:hypothetical protein